MWTVRPSLAADAGRTAVGADTQVGANIGRDLVLLVYAPWCSYCKDMKPDFDRLARGLASDPTVSVVQVRCGPDRGRTEATHAHPQ
jgi:thiol-disulfide isomerase/thioredoxin